MSSSDEDDNPVVARKRPPPPGSDSDSDHEPLRRIQRRHDISAPYTLAELKERVRTNQPVPSNPLQLASGVQGGHGPVSRVDLDNRHVLLCSLVASEQARLTRDAEIRKLYAWNDRLVPLSEQIHTAFNGLLAELESAVLDLGEADRVRELAARQAALDRVRELDTAARRVDYGSLARATPEVPLLADPLCDGLRALTTAPDNHGDALQCYHSNYWLLRVWNSSCSGGRVDMAHVVI